MAPTRLKHINCVISSCLLQGQKMWLLLLLLLPLLMELLLPL